MSAMNAMFKLRTRLNDVKKMLEEIDLRVMSTQGLVQDMEDSLDILSKEASDDTDAGETKFVPCGETVCWCHDPTLLEHPPFCTSCGCRYE